MVRTAARPPCYPAVLNPPYALHHEENQGLNEDLTQETARKLGIVTSGSLATGLDVRLDSSISIEEIKVGQYVTIAGDRSRFLGMITDIKLGAMAQSFQDTPPDVSDPFIARVMAGTATYGILHVTPTLVIGGEARTILEGPQPVKTIPSHFSSVSLSSQRDINLVFGDEDQERFYIGNPLDMEMKVCLNLAEFVKRSNGVFGKSGTGKTFLTRLLLIGMLQKSKAANLVFDMHNEYGWRGSSERGHEVKGLKQLFPSKVSVFTLDEESSRRRGVMTDAVARIGWDEIEPEDIELLRRTLNLTEPAQQAVYQFRQDFGSKHWLEKVLGLEKDGENTRELLERLHIADSTFRNLRRGLDSLKRLPFLVPETTENTTQRILEQLQRGNHVVIEFGRYHDIVAYMLVANMLTRRIYDRYREATEKAAGENKPAPHPLVITIEEAHKFLDPEIANQTIFGTIAREMRKYNVTLLVIDQRPSAIDAEVMSQVGTKLTCLLDNERDVEAVLAGVPGKNELRAVLSRLETRQQALIFGHAVPMPVVVRTREYGSPDSYKDFGFVEGAELRARAAQDKKDLWDSL
ncbi:MAG: ATP-binding protein [Chloroflexi bacterium]|nr:ATP-binding protein [Chloroflexota bacterium]